jgi:hypothetical protein
VFPSGGGRFHWNRVCWRHTRPEVVMYWKTVSEGAASAGRSGQAGFGRRRCGRGFAYLDRVGQIGDE